MPSLLHRPRQRSRQLRNQRAALLLAIAMGACARMQAPVLYPNAHLQRVGREQTERDIEECRKLASEYVKSTATRDIAKGTAIGAAGGAAIGAVGGAVSGHGAGAGAAIGAATGGTAGAVHGAARQTEPSPVYQQFVNRCLHERGYEVLGWQ